MICSMTAFGSARATSDLGVVTIELRSVNNRYLDLNLRLPDDLRQLEGTIRERLTQVAKRGKIELRLNYQRSAQSGLARLDPDYLALLAQQLAEARAVIPDVRAPALSELLRASEANNGLDAHSQGAWQALSLEALDAALADFYQQRLREGAHLAHAMQQQVQAIRAIVDATEQQLPDIQAAYQARLANKLRETLAAAHPAGFDQISGEELSTRISQESLLFTLRIDVAEELTRLRAHLDELERLLQTDQNTSASPRHRSSTGKRLDFLFQEMNREANTLGSKAASLDITNAAIDLKLLIEQLREQAQNIE